MAAGNSRWYFFDDGKQEGPVTWGELQALAQCGRLRANDRVLREGGQTWQPAHTARDVGDGIPPLEALPVATLHGRPSLSTAIHIVDDAGDGVGGGEGVNVGRMLFGLLLCGGGILGTLAGYNAAVTRGGGKYLIFTGPIVYGLSLILRSFGDSGAKKRQIAD